MSIGLAAGGSEMKFPTVVAKAAGPEYTTIQYRRAKAEVREVAEAMGDESLAAREVGKRTFEYFRKMELDK